MNEPKAEENASSWKKLEKDYHDKIAVSYDDLCKLKKTLGILGNYQRVRYLWELFQKTSKSSILDVGCGTGDSLRLLCRKGIPVIGLDFSLEMVKITKKRCSKCDVVVGDVENLPFSAASVSLSYCIATLHHVPHPGKAIKELIRVTKENDYVYIEEPLNNVLFDLARKMTNIELFQKSPCETSFYANTLSEYLKRNSDVTIEKKGYKMFFTMLLANKVRARIVARYVLTIDEMLSKIPYLKKFMFNCFLLLRKGKYSESYDRK